jgi:hypothetical protein
MVKKPFAFRLLPQITIFIKTLTRYAVSKPEVILFNLHTDLRDH